MAVAAPVIEVKDFKPEVDPIGVPDVGISASSTVYFRCVPICNWRRRTSWWCPASAARRTSQGSSALMEFTACTAGRSRLRPAASSPTPE